MNLELKKFLYDIKESVNSMEDYLEGKRDFNIYLSDKMLRRGLLKESLKSLV